MTFRSRRLLDQAHEMPCMADFEHDCCGWQGCEPAHADSHLFGRGAGHKTADCFFAAMCRNAHKMITAAVGGGMNREEKLFCWIRAHAKTMEYLWTNKKLRVA